MRAFSHTGVLTDILKRHEQTFAHVFNTYTPVGLQINTHAHT